MAGGEAMAGVEAMAGGEAMEGGEAVADGEAVVTCGEAVTGGEAATGREAVTMSRDSPLLAETRWADKEISALVAGFPTKPRVCGVPMSRFESLLPHRQLRLTFSEMRLPILH
jgi:hypothetical protein